MIGQVNVACATCISPLPLDKQGAGCIYCMQSLSNIIYSCSKMRPPFRDTAMLEQLAAAALWR